MPTLECTNFNNPLRISSMQHVLDTLVTNLRWRACTDKFDSRAELRKGGFGKLFRDPRKITSPRQAILRGGTMRSARKTGRTTSVFCLRPGTDVFVRSHRRNIDTGMVNWLKTFPALAPPTSTFQSNRFLAQHPIHRVFRN